MSNRMELTAEEQMIMDSISIGAENEVVRNPYSGASVELCPEAVALYDLIKGSELLCDYKTVETGLEMFSRNWPDAYMVLLD